MPELVLPSRINQHWQFSGMDQLSLCLDKNHFLRYPHSIDYCYNSRGFRGAEWPNSVAELQSAIWCIGDSFTLGLGSPLSHTWPFRLSIIKNRVTINVSMDGASNEWIAKVAERIATTVKPQHMVIMWSYTHRREKSDTLVSDEDRRLPYTTSTVEQDWENFLHCKKRVDLVANAVHFAIPEFHPDTPDITACWNDIRGNNWPTDPPTSIEELHQLPKWILTEITHVHRCLDRICLAIETNVITTNRLDLARDGNHFDLITADWVASQAADRLS